MYDGFSLFGIKSLDLVIGNLVTVSSIEKKKEKALRVSVTHF